MVHIWPYVGKAKMCLRGGSFLWVSADFLYLQFINAKNDIVLHQASWSNGYGTRLSCIRSLVRILPWVQKISLLLEKLCNFFTFSNYYFLPQKTTASQTHFGFTNIGSNTHHFCATAIWNPKRRRQVKIWSVHSVCTGQLIEVRTLIW